MYIPPFTFIRVAGDIAGLLGGEKGDYRGDVTGRAGARQRDCKVIAVRCSSVSTAVMAVSMYPGATAFTVIVRLASSRASDRVRPMRPALEAA